MLLLAAVHAVYESHARYHQPVVGFLVLLAVLPVAAAPRAPEARARVAARRELVEA